MSNTADSRRAMAAARSSRARTPRSSSSFRMGERLIAALLGIVFGAVCGFALAWLVGVYSVRGGGAGVALPFAKFALAGAAFLGLAGLLVGANAGSLVGSFVAALLRLGGVSEDERESHAPGWLVLVVLFGVVGVVYVAFVR